MPTGLILGEFALTLNWRNSSAWVVLCKLHNSCIACNCTASTCLEPHLKLCLVLPHPALPHFTSHKAFPFLACSSSRHLTRNVYCLWSTISFVLLMCFQPILPAPSPEKRKEYTPSLTFTCTPLHKPTLHRDSFKDCKICWGLSNNCIEWVPNKIVLSRFINISQIHLRMFRDFFFTMTTICQLLVCFCYA